LIGRVRQLFGPVTLLLSIIAASPSGAQTAASLPRADGAATPVKRYGSQTGCGPTMIISHGLGGNENGNAALAAAMARAGWRVMVLGHRESGPSELRAVFMSGDIRNGLIRAASNPSSHKARFMDVDAAVTELTKVCRPSPFVLAGHSMGALTTMLEAGAVSRFARSGKDRFDAYVAISPQGVGAFYTSGAWTAVRKPVLMITGSQDRTAEGPPETRMTAFEGLPPGRKRFAIISGAGHIALAGNNPGHITNTIAALIQEFLASFSGNRPLPASAIQGVSVTDK
jgi:pimeloyl-ACP methyl ester carboxylesterase